MRLGLVLHALRSLAHGDLASQSVTQLFASARKGWPYRQDPEVITRLQHVADTPFKRVSYTEAIDILKQAVTDGVSFEETNIQWGMDLGSEHERCALTSVYKLLHGFRVAQLPFNLSARLY
jgi:aspartyl/asparaginyl-tRNA synthetase